MGEETEMEAVIRAAVNSMMKPVLALIQDDPHQWSTRPCPTCRVITTMVGEPFGCYKYAAEVKR